jgi:hypothetical protein
MTGVCPVCGEEKALRKDGKIAAHKRMGMRWGSSMLVRVRCGGTGRKP